MKKKKMLFYSACNALEYGAMRDRNPMEISDIESKYEVKNLDYQKSPRETRENYPLEGIDVIVKDFTETSFCEEGKGKGKGFFIRDYTSNIPTYIMMGSDYSFKRLLAELSGLAE